MQEIPPDVPKMVSTATVVQLKVLSPNVYNKITHINF